MAGSSAEKSPGETSKVSRVSLNSDLDLFFSTKCPKIDGSTEEFPRFFGIDLLGTQTSSKSGENVSKIIESDIQLEIDCKLSNLYKVPSVFNLFFFFHFENKLILK